MKNYLIDHELWVVFEETIPPTDATAEGLTALTKELQQKNRKAMSVMDKAVTAEIYEFIIECETPKDAWKILAETFGGDDKKKEKEIDMLWSQVESWKVRSGDSIEELADKLSKWLARLKALGEGIDAKRIKSRIARAIPNEYEPVITSAQLSGQLKTMTPNELLEALKDSENRQKERKDEEQRDTAFQTSLINGGTSFKGNPSYKSKLGTTEKRDREGMFDPCPYCKQKNHLPPDCFWNPEKKCRYCESMGHIERRLLIISLVLGNGYGKDWISSEAGTRDKTLFYYSNVLIGKRNY
ncbi:hypothetical protein M569_05244 [Genlisea aurea]|uniref:Uncharacterized protein n=1 Tax=Genlisea aurea TaxID=192259 RepID=S8EAH0_9LAMI|nr:hypothetical protein M569_05244 [Genlisea aurea]